MTIIYKSKKKTVPITLTNILYSISIFIGYRYLKKNFLIRNKRYVEFDLRDRWNVLAIFLRNRFHGMPCPYDRSLQRFVSLA